MGGSGTAGLFHAHIGFIFPSQVLKPAIKTDEENPIKEMRQQQQQQKSVLALLVILNR